MTVPATAITSGIKGIIFDKDGTLFEFAATWEAWAQSLLLRLFDGDRKRAAELGFKIGFDLERRRFETDSIVIAGTAGEIAATMAQHLPNHTHSDVLDLLNDEAGQAPQVEAVPLASFFADLKSRGLRIGVATNDAEEPARAHLAAAGVESALDFIAGFDSGFGGKPAPGQLFAFCEAMGLHPSQVLMVGDSTHDLRAGQAAGMQSIAVLTGMADEATLAPFATAVFPDIGHIPRWLDDTAAQAKK